MKKNTLLALAILALGAMTITSDSSAATLEQQLRAAKIQLRKAKTKKQKAALNKKIKNLNRQVNLQKKDKKGGLSKKEKEELNQLKEENIRLSGINAKTLKAQQDAELDLTTHKTKLSATEKNLNDTKANAAYAKKLKGLLGKASIEIAKGVDALHGAACGAAASAVEAADMANALRRPDYDVVKGDSFNELLVEAVKIAAENGLIDKKFASFAEINKMDARALSDITASAFKGLKANSEDSDTRFDDGSSTNAAVTGSTWKTAFDSVYAVAPSGDIKKKLENAKVAYIGSLALMSALRAKMGAKLDVADLTTLTTGPCVVAAATMNNLLVSAPGKAENGIVINPPADSWKKFVSLPAYVIGKVSSTVGNASTDAVTGGTNLSSATVGAPVYASLFDPEKTIGYAALRYVATVSPELRELLLDSAKGDVKKINVHDIFDDKLEKIVP